MILGRKHISDLALGKNVVKRVAHKCCPGRGPGWDADLGNVRSLDELPETTRNYLNRLAELTGVPIAIFSVGRNREQTNLLQEIY